MERFKVFLKAGDVGVTAKNVEATSALDASIKVAAAHGLEVDKISVIQASSQIKGGDGALTGGEVYMGKYGLDNPAMPLYND